MKKIIVSALIISSTIVACKTSEKVATTAVPAPPVAAVDCSTKNVTFAADIKPIMDMYCTRCHNDNEKAGYNLQELSFVKKAAMKGDLLGTIKHQKGFPGMPMNAAPLNDDAIAKIECWINNGMK